jgi:hypothetical protein
MTTAALGKPCKQINSELYFILQKIIMTALGILRLAMNELVLGFHLFARHSNLAPPPGAK